MQTLADPITIALLGGRGVGKTALLHRLAGRPMGQREGLATGVCAAEFALAFAHTHIRVTLLDVKADLLNSPLLMSFVLRGVQCACIVIDCACQRSLGDADAWSQALAEQAPHISDRFLIANKVDLLSSSHIVSGGQLDKYSRLAGLVDWAFTTALPGLADIDSARGCTTRQRSISEIVGFLLRLVLHRRQSASWKLVHLPLRLEPRPATCEPHADLAPGDS